MFNYQRLMFNAPITPIQNSEFKIQNCIPNEKGYWLPPLAKRGITA